MSLSSSSRVESSGSRARVIAFGHCVPRVDHAAWVAPGAILVGAVEVDEGASVWYGAVVRADGDQIVVGKHSNIQDAAVLHSDPGLPVTIGRRVTVGHGAILHGCTVEDDVLIGLGAKLLNGSRIGSGSIIAAGAVVREGMEVPPNSLVAGIPAKVLRKTTADARRGIAENARAYSDLAARHAAATAGDGR